MGEITFKSKHMNKIIILLLLVMLFPGNSIFAFDHWKTIVKPNLIKESLVRPGKKRIPIKSHITDNQAEFDIVIDAHKQSYLKIIIRKGGLLLSDVRFEGHIRDVEKWKTKSKKAWKKFTHNSDANISRLVNEHSRIAFFPKIGKRSASPPFGNISMIFTTLDGAYDIKIIYVRTNDDRKCQTEKLAELISARYEQTK